MTAIALTPDSLLGAFAPISLRDLDARASLMERRDRKYVVPTAVLEEALRAWSGRFDALEIGGRRAFAYRSVYFDGAGLPCFAHHRQGRRERFKIRTRHYVDTGACFLEVKLKGARGQTIKRRIDHDEAMPETLDARAFDHIRAVCGEGWRGPVADLVPMLRVGYARTTLVARAGGERITVDRFLNFGDGSAAWNVDPDLAIVETKSASGNGPADAVLRALHQHPVARCSKYCLGLIALGKVERFNRFRPAARHLRLLPASGPVLAG